MAVFHVNAKIISRGQGQSAIAAAAYRSGDRLFDEQDGSQKVYPAGDDRILHTQIMAPQGAPEWAYDRNQLWNHAERAEKRKDAQLAREIEVSLPHELDEKQRLGLIKDYAREAFVRKGYAVDIAIHAPYAASDQRNHHAHLMVTMRTLDGDGFAATKDRSLNSPEQLETWREQWANLANRHLERHGHDARIDHRSLEAQGLDREPTVHLGHVAKEMMERGAQTDRGDDFKGVLQRNDIRVQIKGMDAMLESLSAELTMSQKSAEKNLIWEGLAAAAAADNRTLRSSERTPNIDEPGVAMNSAERGFADAIRAEAQETRQERREEAAEARQEAWRADVAEHRPQAAAGPSQSLTAAPLMVADAVTGTVSKLGDFMVDFFASSATTPERAPSADIGAYVSDPAARKQQQLAHLAERRAATNDEKALEHMARDMKAGKALGSADIQNLTREHQEQIRHFGDDAARQMVNDAQKRAERYWGRERERE